jgi:hypothetical protein
LTAVRDTPICSWGGAPDDGAQLREGSVFCIGVVVAIAMVSASAAPASMLEADANGQASRTEASVATTRIEIPASVRAEHEAIHSLLVQATEAPGRVGAAAKALAEVLHPHFVREEEIALPPLGLLARLAAGDGVASEMTETLAMTDALARELPRMLEEHKRIRTAVENLRVAARADQSVKYERLAEQLALHAQTEEEVLYPAAILVGEVIRRRTESK